MVLALTEGIDGQELSCHPARFADKRLDKADAPLIGAVIENDSGNGQFALRCAGDDGIGDFARQDKSSQRRISTPAIV